jgi:hypothetical protein
VATEKDRGVWLIRVLAILMLAGGGWIVAKHYRERREDRELLSQVERLAAQWSEARVCLTGAPPGSGEDPDAMLQAMSRARDRAMALATPAEWFPRKCLPITFETIDALSALVLPRGGVPPGPYEHSFADVDERRPFTSHRLAELVKLVVRVDADVEGLWSAYGGEGSPFPDDPPAVSIWDEGVLPAFPEPDDCPPTAVTLRIGAETPRRDTVRKGDDLLHVSADAKGAVEVRTATEDGPVVATTTLDVTSEVERVRACATDASLYVVATTDAQARWLAMNRSFEVIGGGVVGDEALAIALRGEDGREVLIACDDVGLSLGYAGDGESVLWICSGDTGRCMAPAPRPTGLPRLGLARLDGTTLLMRHPPESRVPVVEAFAFGRSAPATRTWVVPTIDDRANPELTTEGDRFVLRLCGMELRAAPPGTEWTAVTPAD